jgi:hypothetical protein
MFNFAEETTIVTITMYIEGISSFHAQTMVHFVGSKWTHCTCNSLTVRFRISKWTSTSKRFGMMDV